MFSTPNRRICQQCQSTTFFKENQAIICSNCGKEFNPHQKVIMEFSHSRSHLNKKTMSTIKQNKNKNKYTKKDKNPKKSKNNQIFNAQQVEKVSYFRNELIGLSQVMAQEFGIDQNKVKEKTQELFQYHLKKSTE